MVHTVLRIPVDSLALPGRSQPPCRSRSGRRPRYHDQLVIHLPGCYDYSEFSFPDARRNAQKRVLKLTRTSPQPTATDKLGYKFYIVWTCTNAVFVPIIYFFCTCVRLRACEITADERLATADVETTGQTLEDLDLLFAREKSWFIGPKSATLAREIRQQRNAERQEALTTGVTNLSAAKAGIAGARPLDMEHVENSSQASQEKLTTEKYE